MPLENIGNDRIIAIKVKLPNQKALFVLGTYLPSTNDSTSSYREYINTLEDSIAHLKSLGAVVLAGDFNAHIGNHGGPRSFKEVNNRGHILISLLDQFQFISVNSQELCNGPIETFHSNQGSTLSTIDHIFVNQEHLPLIKWCYVESDNCSNLSYHLPVICSWDLQLPLLSTRSKTAHMSLSWKTLLNETVKIRYQNSVKRRLESLENNDEDSAPYNIDTIEAEIASVTNLLHSAAQESISRKKFRKNRRPYWKDGLNEFHKKSRECRKRWLQNGKSQDRENIYYREYKEAKRLFRKELRKKIYLEEQKQFESLEKHYETDRSTFFKITSSIRKKKEVTIQGLKVGRTLIYDPEEVLSVWKKHYSDLFTPKTNPKYDDEFRRFVEAKITEYESESFNAENDPLDNAFTEHEVLDVCSKLPNGKASGPDGLTYEHIKHAGITLSPKLTRIFNALREFEIVSDSFVLGDIISLFKGGKKNRLNKDHYRGITLLNVIGKIFERLVLQRWLPVFETWGVPNPLQFAYQKNNSCINASFVLQEAVAHNVERGSKVYCCFLHSAKAFDTVWIDGLFFKLYNNGMNGKSWRLLRNWYKRQTSRVRANGLISEKFPVQQGVRQGGVLSPWLFLCFNNDIS